MTVKTKPEAFESLATPIMDQMKAHAFRLTRHNEDAEDLVQDALLKGFSSYHQYQSETNFRAWMFRIITNTYISDYRKKQRRPSTSEFELEDWQEHQISSHTPEGLMSAEESAIYDMNDGPAIKALSKLPDHFRTTVYLADIEGYSYKEIAVIMNSPVGTVMSRLFRGRKLLKDQLIG